MCLYLSVPLQGSVANSANTGKPTECPVSMGTACHGSLDSGEWETFSQSVINLLTVRQAAVGGQPALSCRGPRARPGDGAGQFSLREPKPLGLAGRGRAPREGPQCVRRSLTGHSSPCVSRDKFAKGKHRRHRGQGGALSDQRPCRSGGPTAYGTEPGRTPTERPPETLPGTAHSPWAGAGDTG